MTDKTAIEKNPDLLLEAARVLNQAGPAHEMAAAALAAAALEIVHLAKPKVRDAIMGDVAALYLSKRLPGGCEAALALLKDIDGDGVDEGGRLHLLRALALGQKYNGLRELRDGAANQDIRKKLEEELPKLVPDIEKDLETAFGRSRGDLWKENQSAWMPFDPADPNAYVSDEDDLRHVYEERPEFKEWIDKIGRELKAKGIPDPPKNDGPESSRSGSAPTPTPAPSPAPTSAPPPAQTSAPPPAQTSAPPPAQTSAPSEQGDVPASTTTGRSVSE